MSNFWSGILQQVLSITLPPLAVALVALVIAWIRKVEKGLSADVMDSINLAVMMAVNAAEQAGAAQLIADKKEYALDLAQQYLAKQGIKLDLSLLDGMIESAVKTQINWDETEPVPNVNLSPAQG